MSGFPIRPPRQAFGPLQLSDRRPIVDPSKEMGAQQASLLMWQSAGLGFATPFAWALVTWDSGSSTYSVTAHGCIARPDDQAAMVPTVFHLGTGYVALEWPESTTDETGSAIELQLHAALAIPQGTTRATAAQQVPFAYSAEVNLWNDAAAPADMSFVVVVW